MRLLVTGGAGFIGANFIHFLADEQPQVSAVNLDALTYAGNLANLDGIPLESETASGFRHEFVHGDIRDGELLEELFASNEFDAVINFAAESHVDRALEGADEFLETNVGGTHELLKSALEFGVSRFVQVSTDEVYGELGPDDPAFTEESPLDPQNPYAASKAGADLLVNSFHESFGLDTVITRASNNYGPWQFPEKFLPVAITSLMEGEPIPVYGDGTNVRDWLHVRDHCRGIWHALKRGGAGETYNFGGGEERQNIWMAGKLCNLLGTDRDEGIEFVEDRPGHDKRYAMDYSKAAEELGFEPSYTLEEGLAGLVEWYRDHESWWRTVESGEYRERNEELLKKLAGES